MAVAPRRGGCAIRDRGARARPPADGDDGYANRMRLSLIEISVNIHSHGTIDESGFHENRSLDFLCGTRRSRLYDNEWLEKLRPVLSVSFRDGNLLYNADRRLPLRGLSRLVDITAH